MLNTIISIAAIYGYILLGFIAKTFNAKLDQNTLIYISIYFLQPLLTFWGLMQRPIDSELLLAPFYYQLIVFLALGVLLLFSRFVKEEKERAILLNASLIGNTGNLGIPIGLAIFGPESVAFTSIINIINVFYVYTFAVFFYAKSSFSVKTALLQIFKLPALWAAAIAITLNYYDIKMHEQINTVLTMGAYACIVIQMMIFGIYLKGAAIKTANKQLLSAVPLNKLLLLPLFGFAVLQYVDLEPFVEAIIVIQLTMPIAVNNINLAALYHCKPEQLATLVFATSVLFMGVILFEVPLLEWYYNIDSSF